MPEIVVMKGNKKMPVRTVVFRGTNSRGEVKHVSFPHDNPIRLMRQAKRAMGGDVTGIEGRTFIAGQEKEANDFIGGKGVVVSEE